MGPVVREIAQADSEAYAKNFKDVMISCTVIV
jgi:hypothetical protein